MKYFLVIVMICIVVSLVIVYQLCFRREEIKCPKCGSIHVWTPIGTRSENFLWRCLECNHTWIKSYSEKTYSEWRNNSINTVVYMVMKYISNHHTDAKNFISEKIEWKRKSYSEYPSYIVYRFEDTGWILSITFYKHNRTYMIVADFSVSRIPGYIGIMHRIIWRGIFTFNGEIIEKEYLHAT